MFPGRVIFDLFTDITGPLTGDVDDVLVHLSIDIPPEYPAYSNLKGGIVRVFEIS